MASFSSFDKVLIIFFVLVLGVVFVTAGVNVDQSRPFHQFSQVAVGVEKISSDANVLLAKYGGTGVAQCSDGNLLKWSSAQNSWVCGGVAVTATGLPSCAAWEILKYNGSAWICSPDFIGTTLPSCVSGQIIKYNGSAWVCASDDVGSGGAVGLNYTYLAPTRIFRLSDAANDTWKAVSYPASVPTTASAVVLRVFSQANGWNVLAALKDEAFPEQVITNAVGPNNSDDAASDSVVLAVPYSSDRALQAKWIGIGNAYRGSDEASGQLADVYVIGYVGSSGSVLPVCSNGQVLKYNGSAWVCGTDNIGGTNVSCGFELYDCHLGREVSAGGGYLCDEGELVQNIVSNGGDWGGNDWPVCCHSRVVNCTVS